MRRQRLVSPGGSSANGPWTSRLSPNMPAVRISQRAEPSDFSRGRDRVVVSCQERALAVRRCGPRHASAGHNEVISFHSVSPAIKPRDDDDMLVVNWFTGLQRLQSSDGRPVLSPREDAATTEIGTRAGYSAMMARYFDTAKFAARWQIAPRAALGRLPQLRVGSHEIQKLRHGVDLIGPQPGEVDDLFDETFSPICAAGEEDSVVRNGGEVFSQPLHLAVVNPARQVQQGMRICAALRLSAPDRWRFLR